MGTTHQRQPSLAELRDWCEERADDPYESADDRRMWRQLAAEYTARLGDRDEDTQESLW